MVHGRGLDARHRNKVDKADIAVSSKGFPVAQWFNRAAPRVKGGEVVPEALDAESALTLLLQEHLLIRRPLMQRPDGERLVGFDTSAVERFVGLNTATNVPSSMEGCAAGKV